MSDQSASRGKFLKVKSITVKGKLNAYEAAIEVNGIKSEFNTSLVLRKRLTITGSTLRPRPIAFKQAIAQDCLKIVWPLIEAGVIRPVIHSTFPAVDAADATGSGAARAHALMESNQHIGKLVLTW